MRFSYIEEYFIRIKKSIEKILNNLSWTQENVETCGEDAQMRDKWRKKYLMNDEKESNECQRLIFNRIEYRMCLCRKLFTMWMQW